MALYSLFGVLLYDVLFNLISIYNTTLCVLFYLFTLVGFFFMLGYRYSVKSALWTFIGLEIFILYVSFQPYLNLHISNALSFIPLMVLFMCCTQVFSGLLLQYIKIHKVTLFVLSTFGICLYGFVQYPVLRVILTPILGILSSFYILIMVGIISNNFTTDVAIIIGYVCMLGFKGSSFARIYLNQVKILTPMLHILIGIIVFTLYVFLQSNVDKKISNKKNQKAKIKLTEILCVKNILLGLYGGFVCGLSYFLFIKRLDQYELLIHQSTKGILLFLLEQAFASSMIILPILSSLLGTLKTQILCSLAGVLGGVCLLTTKNMVLHAIAIIAIGYAGGSHSLPQTYATENYSDQVTLYVAIFNVVAMVLGRFSAQFLGNLLENYSIFLPIKILIVPSLIACIIAFFLYIRYQNTKQK